MRGHCNDDVCLLLDQLRREARQSVEVAACIAKFDSNVPAIDVAEVFKAPAKGLQGLVPEGGGAKGKPANLCLLGPLLSQGETGAY